MCCFGGDSPPHVSNTNIFARRRGDRQLLVYEMHLAARTELAMILPLPVAPGAGDDALRFIDLTGHADLFAELDEAFDATGSPDGDEICALGDGDGPLRVEHVGAFEASYVPSLADFSRLDPRFRVDDALWRRLPGYRDAGFAVFQLRPGDAPVHPMAFDFPARWPERLFFPTLHIHGGELPEHADFDHKLFFQGFAGLELFGDRIGPGFERHASDLSGVWGGFTGNSVARFVHGPRTAELFDVDAPVFRVGARARLRNDDTWLVPGPTDPRVAVTGGGASAWLPVA